MQNPLRDFARENFARILGSGPSYKNAEINILNWAIRKTRAIRQEASWDNRIFRSFYKQKLSDMFQELKRDPTKVSLGLIIGPLGLALIVGSNNYLKPDVPLPQIPTAFVYLGCWFLMAGVVYYFFGLETRGKSLEQIDHELAAAD